ncbi:MAG TPA: PKD domain-containing protein [Solirubrobacteraceae bacterium]|nr:PKD domain-containing protein [Solirubrobacteraceae bacterium]
MRVLISLAITALTLTSLAPTAAAVIVRGSNGRFLAVTLRPGVSPATLRGPLATVSQQPRSSASATGEVTYHGGPVVHSSDPFLVYWAPSGESIPADSQSLLERYLADVAADSGEPDDVFGVDRQYYDRQGFADYRQAFDPARQVVFDPRPYPARDVAHCRDLVASYLTCITDGQLQAELKRLIEANGLPTAGSLSELSTNAPVYFVILPTDVNICVDGGLICADDSMCAYHNDFSLRHAGTVLYAAIPAQAGFNYEGLTWPKICQNDGTAAVQEPNGDIADVLVGLLSHEYSETLTDPISPTGWNSPDNGNEVGDNCQWTGRFAPLALSNPNAYSPVLGGSSSSGTLFDQLIHGDQYYTQSEWSNGDGTCEPKPPSGTIVPRITPPAGRIAARTSLRFTPSASTSTHPYSSATWSFGDGSRQSFYKGRTALAPATHTYAAPGSYTITLTLVDNRGNLQSTARTVTVQPPACVVPNVKGKSRRRATEAIRAAQCALASLSIPRRHGRKRSELVVAYQSPRAGTVRPSGTRISLTLVYIPVRHSTPRRSRLRSRAPAAQETTRRWGLDPIDSSVSGA